MSEGTESLFTDAEPNAEPQLVTSPPVVDPRLLPLLEEVGAELTKAMRKFPPFNSPHEGWAVIYEEFHEELAAHVWNDTGRSHEARQEAIQTAAMALRYVADLAPMPDPAKFVGELLTELAKPEETVVTAQDLIGKTVRIVGMDTGGGAGQDDFVSHICLEVEDGEWRGRVFVQATDPSHTWEIKADRQYDQETL